MPTARELLDQADALMRRNRGRVSEPDIPELTDEVGAVVPHVALAAARAVAAHDEPPSEVPELTDVVAGIEDVVIESDRAESDESPWIESELGEVSVTGPAPDSIAVVPGSMLRVAPPPEPESTPAADQQQHSDEHNPAETIEATIASTGEKEEFEAQPGDPVFDAMLGAPSAEAAASDDLVLSPAEAAGVLDEPDPVVPEAATAEAAPEVDADMEAALAAGPNSPSWDAVAEEIRMQVLQRVDIFTDTGLQGELAARLQPVVDRASADLIATINREVGQLLRTYVAEAIEREIAKWRETNP